MKVDRKYLKDLLNFLSRSLSGKIFKRKYELDKLNEEAQKQVIKELIFEEFRNVLYFLEAHSRGQDLISVKFESFQSKEK